MESFGGQDYMELQIIEHGFSVCKIKDLKQVDFNEEFVFLLKALDEVTLVCKSELVPSNIIASESGWRALKVAGILEFGMIGVIAKISKILSEAKISIFVASTYNTDYFFVKEENFEKAIQMLKRNNYTVPDA